MHNILLLMFLSWMRFGVLDVAHMQEVEYDCFTCSFFLW